MNKIHNRIGNPLRNSAGSPLYKFMLAGVVLIGLDSCGVGKYAQTPVQLPETFRVESDSLFQLEANDASIAQLPYNEFFNDQTLIGLIEEGLKQNNDLQVAIKQIDIASLAYTQSKWGNVPTVNLTLGSAAINRPSDKSTNGQMMAAQGGKKYVEDYGTSLAVSWEADIWGKIKGIQEMSLASYLQTQEAAKAVQTQLIAQIALGYYNLLMLDMQLDITEQNLELIDNTLNMIKVQQRLGLATSLSVQQQENTRDQILKSVPAIKQAITTQENGLSVLVGKMPDRVARQGSLADMPTPAYQNVGLPAELLSYRPDVKSSELSVRQAFAGVHVAKVSMYPALSITAQGGLNAFKASNWFSIPGALFGSVAGAITQPVFNNKRLKTEYEQSKIRMEQAELGFKQAMLVAVGEVSDALAAIESLDEQERITVGLVSRSNEAVDASSKLFKQDMATYLDVIMAQNNKLQAELDLATIKAQKLSAITALYRSLGGGWQ